MTSKDPTVALKKYAFRTSTTVLRGHLYRCHLAEWVQGCDDRKLKINGKEAQAMVADYRQKNGQSSNLIRQESNPQHFTKENFIQAIIKFIVSDDQVNSVRI